MEKFVTKNVSDAIFLREQAEAFGCNDGCYLVALRALGAEIHPQDLFNTTWEARTMTDAFESKGLKLDWFLRTEKDISAEDLKVLLNLRSPGNETLGEFTGHFCGISRMVDEKEIGHSFAILPRAHMPRDLRRKLKDNDSQAVVDAQSKKVLINVTLERMADYINNNYRGERTFYMARVRKFR